jgi:hypothetical protein
MKKNLIIGAVLLVVGIVIGWLCRQSCIRPETVIQRDTLVRVDTIRELYPVSIKEEVVEPIQVVARDTIRINDTLYVSLPMEKRTYRRDEYYAEVTGYNPRLTHIEVYPKTVYVNERMTKALPKNSVRFGIEANYLNTVSIPIYFEYANLLHENFEIYGRIAYDLPSKTFGAGIGAKVSVGW